MNRAHLPDRVFTRDEAEQLARLLNGAALFHTNWRVGDLMLITPRRLVAMFERDPRVGTLRTLIETVLDD